MGDARVGRVALVAVAEPFGLINQEDGMGVAAPGLKLLDPVAGFADLVGVDRPLAPVMGVDFAAQRRAAQGAVGFRRQRNLCP